MINTTEFISGLFEKSKILNDLNTTFLSELEFGDLTLTQKLDLFYKNTKYHENILNAIAEIVRGLDKTSVLLSEEQKELISILDKYDDYTKFKLNKVLKALTNTMFIPKDLTTCPICGNKITSSSSHVGGCKRVPLQIGDTVLGYTIHCVKKGDETSVKPE